jgi:hypothetical protein
LLLDDIESDDFDGDSDDNDRVFLLVVDIDDDGDDNDDATLELATSRGGWPRRKGEVGRIDTLIANAHIATDE